MNKILTVLATTLIPTAFITLIHFASLGFLSLESTANEYASRTLNSFIDLAIARIRPLPTVTPTLPLSLPKIIKSEALSFRLKPELIEAIIEIESNWKPNAIKFEPTLLKGSTEQDRMLASSHGLLQVLGASSKACPNIETWADLYTPEKNIHCGCLILSKALHTTHSVKQALIAYNGGDSCYKYPKCLLQAEKYASKVLNALAEKMIN